jgi:hypothetical protein
MLVKCKKSCEQCEENSSSTDSTNNSTDTNSTNNSTEIDMSAFSGMMDLLHPADCKFPFTYKDKSYDSCTGDGAKGFTWCAHNSAYTSGKEGVTWEKCPDVMHFG